MIEPLPEFLDAGTFPRFAGIRDKGNIQVLIEKVNQLVEASNRQDRILAVLLANTPGGMEQHVARHEDYTETMKSYEEEESGG